MLGFFVLGFQFQKSVIIFEIHPIILILLYAYPDTQNYSYSNFEFFLFQLHLSFHKMLIQLNLKEEFFLDDQS